MTPLLEVTNLSIGFANPEPITAVDDVSFRIDRSEVIALVGESGCGKTLTGLAIPGLLPSEARTSAGSRVVLDGNDLVGMPEAARRRIRGARIAMVFQDPQASLNPVMRVGDQVIEAIRAHGPVPRAEARTRAAALLEEVGIADAAARLDAWPHELSGGMRQRVMIAIALAGAPVLLLANDPTPARDVTIQAQSLELLDRLRRARGLAVLLITHDLGIVASRADRVLVMYAGRIIESAPTAELFRVPRHPYTRGLLAAVPRVDAPESRLEAIAGSVPQPGRWPPGCRFHPRCPVAIARCGTEAPSMEPAEGPHHTACWVATGAGS